MGPHRADGVGEALEAVTHHDQHVETASVADLGEDLGPELGAFAAVAGPQTQDVAFAVDGDRDRGVDRPVRDLPIADLHVDRVDEHHRIHPIQRPRLPLGELADEITVLDRDPFREFSPLRPAGSCFAYPR